MATVAAAVAEILKREGVDYLIGYPVNPIIEAAAAADIRTIIVRQERTGLHMADAVSRVTSGERIGVFAMQFGPGTENAFGGVAQAFGESVPIVVLPGGYPRTMSAVTPNFSAYLNFQHITKFAEQVTVAEAVPDALRRAFTRVKNGRPRPVLVEIPKDIFDEELPAPLAYQPAPRVRSGPDPERIGEVARVLVEAKRPVIYAGQGVHYAQAWPQLRTLAELPRRRSPPACRGRVRSRKIIRSRLAPAAGPCRNRFITFSPAPTSSSGLAAALRRPPTA
jgi:thiamine pyrophosphate-dependent acetolactate synthase large subunit-like protein